MSPFDFALAQTLEYEGGSSNHPLDRGGRTNRGITQRSYDLWRATTGRFKRSVDLIEDQEVRQLYHDDYWTPCNCDALPEALACAVFDMAVNSGTWNAKLTLQRAVRTQADGVIGPVTLAAIKVTPDVVLRFLERRMGYIQEVITVAPSQVAFLEGWGKRLLRQAYYSKGTP